MKAMVLTAGRGTRLHPLTKQTPKVLLPVGGIPLLDYTLRWLASHGIAEVVLNLHHLGDQIKKFVGDGRRYGLSLFFSHEVDLLGTAGGVKQVAERFSETFAVIYGDVLTDMDLRAMLDHHRGVEASVSIAVQEAGDVRGKGVIDADNGGRMRSFVEKPERSVGSRFLINAGIYLLEPDVLEHVPHGFSDFGSDIFPELLQLGVPIYIWILRPWEYLIDVGTPEMYKQANEDIAHERIKCCSEKGEEGL